MRTLSLPSALGVALVLSAAAVAVAVADAPAALAPFSFYDYLLGEWEVVRGTAQSATGESAFDDTLRGHYYFEKENGTSNLIGRYYDNDTTTGEVTNMLSVLVEFTTPVSGVFKTSAPTPSSPAAAAGGSDDESESAAANTLFEFDFEQQQNTGFALSFGMWKGNAKPTHYQFAATAWDRFLITLFPRDAPSAPAAASAAASAEVVVFMGRKIPQNVEKTFWQKYSTMLMLGGFFFFNMFVQRKARGYQAQQMATARRQTGNLEGEAADTASGKKKGGAKVELADDSTDSNSTSGAAKKKA